MHTSRIRKYHPSLLLNAHHQSLYDFSTSIAGGSPRTKNTNGAAASHKHTHWSYVPLNQSILDSRCEKTNTSSEKSGLERSINSILRLVMGPSGSRSHAVCQGIMMLVALWTVTTYVRRWSLLTWGWPGFCRSRPPWYRSHRKYRKRTGSSTKHLAVL